MSKRAAAVPIDPDVVGRPVEMTIQQRGAVVVNHASMCREGPGIACITIDLRSKYAVVDSVGGEDNGAPCVWLAA
ncbi:MAG TPA: hypothetical protein VJ608_06725, partial [Albitalea sp.]|nr:hypothetical protein [Albitalea sp.]